ncbi:DNA-binding SARP family transcriptional activator [Kibdelosporangium banguiense]|uniref:DNA-binding SARP family transcriptional activator n=1 Tax=Kibdelosporangium banguiense TaxID=1365924 RepID=A0ABS4U156_9PSEU|nr:BTAD domain-containing putative transcriptional regulator [Kibdelosporangium banguiense]MBP2329964.1 DNA-binding SARP family transcriptional activator [Kibdelosporangium banguiense]
MRFRLLGPLEILGVRIPADKQRTVLAMLLVHAGNVVPVSTLITEVWGEQPPRSAAPNLRGYVMQLRRLLPADDQLVTSKSGYQLLVDPDDFDLPRFEQLAAAGRQALAQANLTAANEAFTAAVSLWRGDVAEDVPLGPILGETVTRLAELYLATVEDHVEVELALGRHAQITAPLRTWIRQHPLREKLHSQLMLALYRSGDVPGALEAFTAARRTLADELGIDPGPELSRLHEQVLQRDPSLLLSRVQASVPHQLPPEPAVFVGRAAELASADGPVVAFHGPGGVGKSTLALKVAHSVADQYPDGQLYVDLQGSSPGLSQLEPAEVVGRFLRALGVPPNEVAVEPAEAFARYQSLLADRRVLVVLDNAADAGQVNPLLPANRDCAVLITSRTPLTTVDARQVPVDVLNSQDSLHLLGLLAGNARIAAESRAAAEITMWCGGHPLALRIAGARLAGRPDWTLSQFGARLADRRRRLDELRVADLTVRTSFAIGYESLGRDVMAAKAFRLMGVLGVPEVGVELVAMLLDVDDFRAEQALDHLVEVRLLDPVPGARFRTHDLLRLYAAELAAAEDPFAERTEALRRALDWYLEMCRRAEAQEFDSFDAELPCLVAAATQAAEREPAIARFAIDLVPEIRSLTMKRSHWRELATITDLALTVARRDKDSRGEAATLAISSTMEWRAGQIDQARAGMRRALALWREIGDPEGEGLALHNLGWLSMWTNDLDQALEHLTESLRLLRAHNSAKVIIAQHNLSEVLLRLGKHTEAVDSFHACLDLRLRTDDKIGESVTLVALGRAYCLMDQRADALRTLDNAIACCRQVGNRDDEWEALLCRSEIWLRDGNPNAALADALAVQALTTEIEDDYGQATAARQLARAHTILGDLPGAAAARRRAYELLACPATRRDPILEQLLAETL